jgi:sulfate permease
MGVSPLFSLVVSYNLVNLFLDFDMYAVLVEASVFIAAAGSISLIKPIGLTRPVLFKEGNKVK